MSVRQRSDRALNVLLTLLLLPARLLEEGIHALAALPYAEWVSVEVNPGSGTAETVVQYREDTPQWAITAAHVAPEVLAALAGLATIAWWTVGGPVWWPATTVDWLLLWFIGVQYLAVALPEEGAARPDGEELA